MVALDEMVQDERIEPTAPCSRTGWASPLARYSRFVSDFSKTRAVDNATRTRCFIPISVLGKNQLTRSLTSAQDSICSSDRDSAALTSSLRSLAFPPQARKSDIAKAPIGAKGNGHNT